MLRLNPPLVRGDAERIEFIVTDPDGTPRNISGDTFRFSAKTSINRTEVLIEKSSADGIVVTNAAEGEGYVEILPADTEGLQKPTVLVCDIEGTPAGSPAKPYTQLLMVSVSLDAST